MGIKQTITDGRQRATDGSKHPRLDHLKKRDNLAPDVRDDLPTTLVNESPNVPLRVALCELGGPATFKNMG